MYARLTRLVATCYDQQQADEIQGIAWDACARGSITRQQYDAIEEALAVRVRRRVA